MFKRILHPTDFSRTSAAALDLALSLARDAGAELVLVHVAPPPPVVTEEGVVNEWNYEPYRRKLLEELAALVPPGSKAKTDYRVETGDAVESILRLADETGADVIVMGSAGKNWLERVLLGTVAEQVLRRARCPVLTVKLPPEK